MAKVRIIQLKIKTYPGDTHPIVMRFSKGKQRNYIFFGYACAPDQWNENLCRFKTNYKEYKDHNIILASSEERADDIIREFKRKHIDLTFPAFKKRYEPKKLRDQTVFQYFDQVINQLKADGKIGNANAIMDAKNSLKKYAKNDNLTFPEISVQYLNRYKNWLQSRTTKAGQPLSDRTISVYLRSLRAVYNRALEDDLVDRDLYPFGKGKFSLNKGLELQTRKRAISKASIQAIWNYKTDDMLIDEARMMFIFSYLCGGMNWNDMCRLKWGYIKSGRIEYKRQKTRKEYSFGINEPIQKILDYFNQYGSEYIFPILSKKYKTETQKYYRIKTYNKKFNDRIRSIAGELDIPAHITSYVARHSSASVLYKNGKHTSQIKEFLGHQREQETNIYLQQLDHEEIDKLKEDLL